ncbi:histidinol-phosphate transaminase [Flavobacterium haoranii]|uniref:Histidinol-phosphate aminotransferase n=1 Tax=Flavobacterium haoranii TaxID=683124 RepID=A0A1M6HNN7_9FLAO|nr:histidinol-phosphate transaminase [Flavobacterium haoranii]SHJ23753.1 histidinol-phosphate aminotransferase [Flavobacterium haoranii]
MKTFDLNTLVRTNVKSLKPYSSARDEFKDFNQKMIYLDANENPFENGVNRYPDPKQQDLKALLASKNGVKAENILIGNGSDEVLDLIFRAFCEPNKDNIITLPPTYGMYGVLADINAIENKKIILKPNFQPDVEAILNEVTKKTKLIFLCSPNNPTGNSFSDEAVLKIINNFKGLVVIDEAYIDFSKDKSWLSVLSDFPNLVITQTLSKAYGMAGLRIGILYASKAIISILNKIKPPYNINELSQQKAIELLSLNKTNTQIKELIFERNRVAKVLTKIPFVLDVYPSDANFILFKVDNAVKRYNQLLNKGIVIRNRTNEPLCDNCLRITIGTSDENEKVISILKTL